MYSTIYRKKKGGHFRSRESFVPVIDRRSTSAFPSCFPNNVGIMGHSKALQLGSQPHVSTGEDNVQALAVDLSSIRMDSAIVGRPQRNLFRVAEQESHRQGCHPENEYDGNDKNGKRTDPPGNYAGDVIQMPVCTKRTSTNLPVQQPLPVPTMTTRARSKATDPSKPVFSSDAGYSFGDNGIIYIKSPSDIPLVPTQNSILDYVFVYEFEDIPSKEGTPLIQRWMNCSNLYFVFQGTQQLGVARTLESHHFQMEYSSVVENLSKLLSSCDNCPRIVIIGPSASYNDDNFFIKLVPPDNPVIPLDVFEQSFIRTRGMSKDRSRQDDNTDFGYCTSISCGR